MPNKPTYEELEQRVKQLEKESDKHKHAEEALREFETKFLTVFRSNPSGMVITKLVTGECIDLNESFSSITGYAREEAIGRTSIQIGFWIEPGDREKVTQQIKYQNGFRELEFNFRSKTGEIRSGLFSTEIVNIKGEQCIITTLNDITKRKRAEKALKESEGRFRRLSEAAEEGVVIHERGMILECNEALARMLRSTVSEVIGTHVPQYMTTESWEKVRQYITSGYDKPYEITAIRMDGTPFPCEVTGKSYEFEGNILRVGALRDITERKQAEEEKRKALEFAAEQSKHALIGQVAGKMAHDFNNILMGIMGNSQLAIMDCDNKEIKKQLENIMEFS
ncbi:MAG: PAS domain S-box protein, partial [bacterium]|nr:PAS domain S-box protein [bacterium]